MNDLDSLTEIRKEIDAVDEEMRSLFEKRMELVSKIFDIKKEKGMDIVCPERENEILSKAYESLSDSSVCEYYMDFFRNEIESSKRYQMALLEKSGIIINRGSLYKVSKYFDLDRKVLVITDSGVPKEYADIVMSQSKDPYLIVLDQGEKSKSAQNYFVIQKFLSDKGFTRNDCIVAVGGGMVGDISGFCAATYMRGIDFYNVPTTILSQVDSSIGGKNGIDLTGYKNTVGTIREAKCVLIDTSLTSTLDDRQFGNGLAEAVKTGMVLDENIIKLFESGDINENLDTIVSLCVSAKKKIVLIDPYEHGIRRCLNFGHTIGHAIESIEGFERFLHGECVAMGMIPMCGSEEARTRLVNILSGLELPLKWYGNINKLNDFMKHDKKYQKGKINAVICNEIGKFEIVPLTIDEITERYEEAI